MSLVATHPDESVAKAQMKTDPARQARMIAALVRTLERTTGKVDLFETHISFVLVTPTRAYKIKKPVDLEFLDFTTMDARKLYCEEEVRLNARLAPSIYLGVVAITGTVDAPCVGGSGALLDYAVEMRTFSQHALLSHMLARRTLAPAHVDSLAQVIARFHERIAHASVESPFGHADGIRARALDNFAALRDIVGTREDRDHLDVLQDWTLAEYGALQRTFEARRKDGFVRECHGDLHLGNVLLLGNEIVPFDCIEFNADLRWIDVMSEVAFAVMDLDAHGDRRSGARLLNAYLELTGDYAGLRVMPFYLVYRAMVRAKIAAIRAAQLAPGDERDALGRRCSAYLDLALGYTVREPATVVITRGFSGAGKTTFTQPLLEHLRAVRLRSDVERKRAHGLAAATRTRAGVATGIYAARATIRTYRALAQIATQVMDAGFAVIVDATFLKRWQRAMFRDLAARAGAAFVLVDFVAPRLLLEQRVDARARAGNDASEATLEVLARQIASEEPLTTCEIATAVSFDATMPVDRAQRPECWASVMQSIAEQRRTVDLEPARRHAPAIG